MTAREMSDRMDILLNSYKNQHAYGNQQGDLDFTLTEYEKSIFLTKAEYDIVRYYYLGTPMLYNTNGEPFEYSETIRRALDALVIENSSLPISAVSAYNNPVSNTFTNYSVNIVSIKDDLWFIVYEKVLFDKGNSVDCDPTYCEVPDIDIIPVKHDELRKLVRNPFKRPNNKRVYRLDMHNHIELVSRYPIGKYILRYVSKPNPIITADLPDDVTVEGLNTTTNCELNTVLHDYIVEYAVQMAIQSKSFGQTENTQK